jgi:uncharacterized protein (TIGR02391 family)
MGNVAELQPALEFVERLRRSVPQPKPSAPEPVEQIEGFWQTNRIHPRVREVAKGLYEGGHFSQAVLEALKMLDKAVAKRARCTGESGAKLMRTVFSPNSPLLRWQTFTGQSAQDEQEGHMHLFAGLMTGVRNPRAHESGYADEKESCEDILVVVSYSMKKLDKAKTVSRSRRTP